tara:strand:+ start:216 stop:449 length:234 start_codon:yes stop_codon:yes gene_type:complete
MEEMKVETDKLKRGDIIALMRLNGIYPKTEVLRVLLTQVTKWEFRGQILFSTIKGYNVGETYDTTFAGMAPKTWRIV